VFWESTTNNKQLHRPRRIIISSFIYPNYLYTKSDWSMVYMLAMIDLWPLFVYRWSRIGVTLPGWSTCYFS